MLVISKERERAVFNKSCRWKWKALIVSLIVDNIKNVFMQNMKRKHEGEEILVSKKRKLGQLQLSPKNFAKTECTTSYVRIYLVHYRTIYMLRFNIRLRPF